MSRVYRFAVIALIWLIAILIHYFGVLLFEPSSQFAELVDPAVGTFIDSEWKGDMYVTFAQNIPLLFIALSLLWGFAKEYEEQVVTGRIR